MSELKKTLTDIARTASPKQFVSFPTLRKQVRSSLEFRNYLKGPPQFSQVGWEDLVGLLEAAMADCIDAGEFCEFEEYLKRRMSLQENTVRGLIRHRTGADANVNVIYDDAFADIVSLFRAAAHMYFEDQINKIIEEEYDEYCKTYGVFSPDSDAEPGTLTGFRDD